MLISLRYDSSSSIPDGKGQIKIRNRSSLTPGLAQEIPVTQQSEIKIMQPGSRFRSPVPSSHHLYMAVCAIITFHFRLLSIFDI